MNCLNTLGLQTMEMIKEKVDENGNTRKKEPAGLLSSICERLKVRQTVLSIFLKA